MSHKRKRRPARGGESEHEIAGAIYSSEDSNTARQSQGSKRPAESDDDYPRAVAGPVGRHRIIRCPDDLQFILQSYRKPYWRGVWFFRTVEGARLAPALCAEAQALFDRRESPAGVVERRKQARACAQVAPQLEPEVLTASDAIAAELDNVDWTDWPAEVPA